MNGGAGQVGPIGNASARNRAGVFVGILEQRFVLGGEVDRRSDDADVGDNTLTNPRTVSHVTTRLLSGILVARPLAFERADGKSPFGIALRYDYVNPTEEASGVVQPTLSSDAYHTLIAGLFADLSSQAQVALDYQEQLTSSGAIQPPNPSKGYFVHFVVSF